MTVGRRRAWTPVIADIAAFGVAIACEGGWPIESASYHHLLRPQYNVLRRRCAICFVLLVGLRVGPPATAPGRGRCHRPRSRLPASCGNRLREAVCGRLACP